MPVFNWQLNRFERVLFRVHWRSPVYSWQCASAQSF